MVIVIIIGQTRGGGLGGIFGGGGGDSSYRTRRGLERTLFRFTIVLVVVFIVFSILAVRFG